MSPIYLVVGVPGVGKTTVCNQLKSLFRFVPHDDYTDGGYFEALDQAANRPGLAVLGELPFGVAQMVTELEEALHEVVTVFIVEEPGIAAYRYEKREGREIPTGHLTRQETYRRRARETDSFYGTADEVLAHLRDLAP